MVLCAPQPLKFTKESSAVQSIITLSSEGIKQQEPKETGDVASGSTRLTRRQSPKYAAVFQLVDIRKSQRKEKIDTLKLGMGSWRVRQKEALLRHFLLFQSLINNVLDFSVFFVLWKCNTVVRIIHLPLLHLLVQFKLKPETLQIPLHNAFQCLRL